MQGHSLTDFDKKKIVLVDDDILVRMTWKIAAKSKNIDLTCYESPEQLRKDLHQYDVRTLFFIDSNLGQGQKGEDFVKELFHLGFLELYLSTGYSQDEFESLRSIVRAIVGKDPPWSEAKLSN